jgi:hypothetical protein
MPVNQQEVRFVVTRVLFCNGFKMKNIKHRLLICEIFSGRCLY